MRSLWYGMVKGDAEEKSQIIEIEEGERKR